MHVQIRSRHPEFFQLISIKTFAKHQELDQHRKMLTELQKVGVNARSQVLGSSGPLVHGPLVMWFSGHVVLPSCGPLVL